MDSDDFVADNYCEAMFLLAKELNADLVECGYNECRSGKSKANLRCLKDEVLNKAEFTDKIFKAQIVNGTESVVVWGKLYLRDIILNNIEDYGQCPLEDYYFNMQYYRLVERYAYVSQRLYNYNITDNSLSRSFNKNTYFVLKEVQPRKEMILKSSGLFSDEIKEECAFWYCRYTENYLKNSPKVFDENQLFYEIIKDEELCKQANIIRDKNKFASYIAGGRYRSAYYYVRRGAVLSSVKRCVKRIIRR